MLLGTGYGLFEAKKQFKCFQKDCNEVIEQGDIYCSLVIKPRGNRVTLRFHSFTCFEEYSRYRFQQQLHRAKAARVKAGKKSTGRKRLELSPADKASRRLAMQQCAKHRAKAVEYYNAGKMERFYHHCMRLIQHNVDLRAYGVKSTNPLLANQAMRDILVQKANVWILQSLRDDGDEATIRLLAGKSNADK